MIFFLGGQVRFPGPSRYDPRIFEFYTPYETMYKQLKAENPELCVDFFHTGDYLVGIQLTGTNLKT